MTASPMECRVVSARSRSFARASSTALRSDTSRPTPTISTTSPLSPSTALSAQASQRQLHLFQLDAMPLQPGRDFVLLEDVESGETRPCGEADSAHAAALERYARLQQQLSHWSGRYRIPHSLCHGNDNWRLMLLRHFTGY